MISFFDITSTSFGLAILFCLVVLGNYYACYKLISKIYYDYQFKRKYVVPYKEKPGVRKRDPITMQPFKEGDLVVDICDHLIAFDTWQHLGNTCPHYPNCLNYDSPCEGKGGPKDKEQFFYLQNKLAGAIWVGLLVGVVAYIFSVVLALFFKNSPNLTAFTSNGWFQSAIMFFLFIAVTIVFFLLSLYKASTLPRIINLGNLILKTFLYAGVLLCVLLILSLLNVQGAWRFWAFASLAILSYLLLLIDVSRPVIWKNMVYSLLGGVFLTGLFYVPDIFGSSFTLAIQYMMLGVVFTLISYLKPIGSGSGLKDFYLELLRPEAYAGRKFMLSKWLLISSMDKIHIGRSPSCHVYIKWEDETVDLIHAGLSFEKEKVWLSPLSETLVNGRLVTLKQNISLEDGDVIQLGRNSNTLFTYRYL